MHDLLEIKERYGIPETMQSCHTALMEGYVVEGHVPAGALWRLLAEKPAIRGIALPGMPSGSPGMTGTKTEKFEIYALTDEGSSLYMVY